MIRLFIHHQVSDFNKWKMMFDASEPIRKKYGEKTHQIFRSTSDLNDVTVLFEWNEVKNAVQFVKSPEVREAMKMAGVVGSPTIYLVNEDLGGLA